MGIERKKIAVLCDYRLMPDRIGGMDHFFWQFNTKCKDQNIEIDWFFPNIESHGGYKKLNIIAANGMSIEGLFLNHIQKNKPTYSHVITHFLELCTSFFKEVKSAMSTKIIAVDHNPRPLHGYPLKKKITKRIKGILYSNYIDVFVGVSQYTVNELVRDFGKQIKPKCQVIYNGILLESIKTRPVRNTTNPSFLVASHLRQSKGVQNLIEAVAKLPLELKDSLKIDVYGEGPYKMQLLEKIKYFDVEENFNFKGSSSNLLEIFYKYDYLIHPTHMECFSLTLLESLAANVPVITTPVGGNTEVISDGINGFLFNTMDTAQLKTIIEDLLKGTIEIKGNTRGLIEESFGLVQMVENHINLLK